MRTIIGVYKVYRGTSYRDQCKINVPKEIVIRMNLKPGDSIIIYYDDEEDAMIVKKRQ